MIGRGRGRGRRGEGERGTERIEISKDFVQSVFGNLSEFFFFFDPMILSYFNLIFF